MDYAERTARIRALGRTIEPAVLEAAQAIFTPQHETEPYDGVRVTRDVRYGAHDRHRLDVYAPDPAGAKRPVLLFVHGGGFTGGDKKRPGTPYQDNVALWAVRHGMVGINMTYRLAPAAPWPAGIEDIAAAIAWIRANGAAHGGDAGRIFLMGTSAGATHVACYAAGRSPEIAGAIMLSGVYDLETTEPRDSLKSYFGADIPAWSARSPLRGLIDGAVPLMFVLAEFDPPDFERQALAAVSAFSACHGRWPHFVRLMGHNHFTATLHLNTDDDYLGRQIVEFVAAAS
ncbi:MAG: alpha/beta hydrolase [Rhodospirillaceae bacterium]